jgi:hypothetical protein
MSSGFNSLSVKWSTVVLVLVASLQFACPAQASTIDIQFVAFPIHYGTLPASANYDFYDTASPAGGGTNLATATQMGAVTVSVDGVVQYTYSANQVYGDLLAADVGNLTKTGLTVFAGDSGGAGPNNTFGFDLLTSSGSLLSLNFNNSDIAGVYRAYSSGANSGKPFYVSLGGPTSSIVSQNLPLGLQIGNDASISLSGTTFTNLTTSGSLVTSFDASVTGTITGSLVPEPGTIVLLGIGLLGLACYVPFRRRASRGAPAA